MRSTLTTVTFAATLCLALCGLSVRSAITIHGSTTPLNSANFFYASSDFATLSNVAIVEVTVLPGCIPVLVGPNGTTVAVTTSVYPAVTLYQFTPIQIIGPCFSYADVITSPEFAVLNASASVFALPIQENYEEGYLDPIGNKALYVQQGYALVSVSMVNGALLSTAAASGQTVTLTSDQGNWLRFGQTGYYMAFRVMYGGIFWSIALFTLVMSVMTVINDGFAYNVFKYNNLIYWCIFFSSFFLAFECSYDMGALGGKWSLGQWMVVRFVGYSFTTLFVSLLISAWAHVVAKIPINGLRSWTSTVIQVGVACCFISIIVCVFFNAAGYFTMEALSPMKILQVQAMLAGGAFQFLLCVWAFVFGFWLLHLLRKFGKQAESDNNKQVHFKTTVLMIATVMSMFVGTILMFSLGNLYWNPPMFFVTLVIDHFFMVVMQLTALMALRVSGFHYSSHSSSHASNTTPRQQTANRSPLSSTAPAKTSSPPPANKKGSFQADDLIVAFQANQPAAIALASLNDDEEVIEVS